jgi:hypothetical protein
MASICGAYVPVLVQHGSLESASDCISLHFGGQNVTCKAVAVIGIAFLPRTDAKHVIVGISKITYAIPSTTEVPYGLKP